LANASFANGLQPKRHLNGSPWNGQLERCVVLASDATALFQGDLVKSTGTADVNGIQAVTRLTANTDQVFGVIVGFDTDFSNLTIPHQFRSASTYRGVLICTDPTVIFEVQSTGTAVAADIGLNCGVTFTAGSTVNGLSGMQADKTTVATTATLPLKIVGWVQRPDVDVTDGANMKLNVLLNNHWSNAGVVGV
jgi:hypothetical protein